MCRLAGRGPTMIVKTSPVTSTSPVVRGHRRDRRCTLDGIITALRAAGYEFSFQRADLHRWTLRRGSLIIDLGT
jgi:hypothetical protein